MVEITSRKPVLVFKVLDRDGQLIGEVVQPKVVPVVGRGARTILLVRSEPGSTALRSRENPLLRVQHLQTSVQHPNFLIR
jgi:hypothetical protein